LRELITNRVLNYESAYNNTLNVWLPIFTHLIIDQDV
jgi:hypothetical protein